MLNSTSVSFKSASAILAALGASSTLLTSAAAYALEPVVAAVPDAVTQPAPAQTQAPLVQSVHADIGLGFVTSKGSDFEGALILDGLITGRHGYFAAGATGELGTGLFGNDRAGFGGVAGIALPPTSPVELSLLAEGGWHAYFGVRKPTTLFSNDRGTGGSLGYVGLRLGLNVPVARLRESLPRPVLGVALYARLEPSSSSRSYTYTETGFFSERTTIESRTVEFGGTTEFGLTLRGGVDWFSASK